MTKKKIEALEKLVISLLVQIQEIKCSQDIVNRGPQEEVTGSGLLSEASHLHEDFLELIFLKGGGDGIDFS